MSIKIKSQKRERRKRRIRSRIFGSPERPRMSVFRSNKYIYAQIIDDTSGVTLVSASSKKIGSRNKMEKAKMVGEEIAKKAKLKRIEKVVFDRNGYSYTGSISVLANAARESGLKF